MKKRQTACVCTSITGKLDLRKRFHGRWVKKSNRISLWGDPIIWRYRGNKKKKKIPEHLNTLGGINDGRILLSGFSLRRKKEKSKKEHFFTFCSTRGLNPRPSKKWQNRMSIFASTLVPSTGTCPGFTGLGGNRGKYIYELH